MSTITLRLEEEEKLAVSGYARTQGMSVSEFARRCMLEKLEDEYDLSVIAAYEKAHQDGEVKLYSHEVAWEMIEHE